MEFEKYTGKTLEEAVQAAAEAKGVQPDEIHYEITEEKAGFLGIGKTVEISAYCEKDVQKFIVDYIQQYFDNAELDGTVSLKDDNGFYRVSVNVSNNAVLIGKGGRTLQFFNRLVKAAASAQFKKRVGVLIDVNGYKKDRYKKLCRLAVLQARDVQRTKIDASLDPMPADERKAIHNALADMNHITTKSEGEGDRRHINILYTPSKEVDK
ncbi:protein jag [Catenisphaera adipataccumulans]|uniref:SpoIIIJ-associated protein n=1 Tax=Catenisphaera adipataccumulans TaxID=700500 RepID=A0A7W8CYB3_9FIRM|nr:R3H domain-containing nucleic acid-binding protein [Catenisphaera adipataccumulans]MBB5183852.1 spoIIIJ-associated protein [Catenisphaera adipataccumulans]